LKLLDLYIPLKARMELPEGDTWKRELSLAGRDITDHEQELLHFGEPVPLLDILKNHSGVIILGTRVRGKTTFVKYLALRLARGEGAKIGLDDYPAHSAAACRVCQRPANPRHPLDDFIAEYFAGIGANLPIGPMLSEALKAGRALILLDGLDEVRDINMRNTVVERVVDFLRLPSP
jgi:predicted NACHT family NTPase